MGAIGFRAVVQWHLFLAAVAVVAFWTYYATLDAGTAASLGANAMDTQGGIAHAWIAEKRAFVAHYWSAFTGWRDNVNDGLTTPR